MPDRIKPLRTLFRTGSCSTSDELIRPLLDGLAHVSEDGRFWVLSRQLLRVREDLTLLLMVMNEKSYWSVIQSVTFGRAKGARR